jgi:regulator of cell morphogenesis and NO signaling
MSTPFVYVTATSTVDDIMRRYPATGSIFSLLGLDTCCGAKLTLRDAAYRAGTDLGVLLSMLEASACASLVGAGQD